MTGEQAGWTTDENGTRFFRHNGWEVTVWGPQWTWERMEVTSPRSSDSVWADDNYIYAKGESHGHFGPEAEVVVVPLPIVRAMIEAREMINEQHRQVKVDD